MHCSQTARRSTQGTQTAAGTVVTISSRRTSEGVRARSVLPVTSEPSSSARQSMTLRPAPGDLDPSFGTGGKVTTHFDGEDSAFALALLPNRQDRRRRGDEAAE